MGEKEKLYKKQWFMWVLLVFVPPIGIIFMWVSKKDITTKKKGILSIIFGLWFLILMAMGGSDTNDKTVQDTVEPVVEQTEPTTEEAVAETKEEVTPEQLKTNAEIADTKIMALINSMDTHYTDFVSVIENSGNDLDLYNSAKDIEEVGLNVFDKVGNIECDDIEGYSEYIDASQMYASYIRDIGDKVQKYIDKSEMKYLSEAQESMKTKTSIALDLLNKRMTFLTNAGFTEEEVINIIGANDETAE
ncbi:MAG: hypothetical protein ACERKZ_02275 [Lachnotalea sp.]